MWVFWTKSTNFVNEEKDALSDKKNFLGIHKTFDAKCQMLSPFQLQFYYVLSC
jgi:hypothetical protein